MKGFQVEGEGLVDLYHNDAYALEVTLAIFGRRDEPERPTDAKPPAVKHPYLNLFRAAGAASEGRNSLPLLDREVGILDKYFPALSSPRLTEKIPFNAEFLISSLNWSLEMYERLMLCERNPRI